MSSGDNNRKDIALRASVDAMINKMHPENAQRIIAALRSPAATGPPAGEARTIADGELIAVDWSNESEVTLTVRFDSNDVRVQFGDRILLTRRGR